MLLLDNYPDVRTEYSYLNVDDLDTKSGMDLDIKNYDIVMM